MSDRPSDTNFPAKERYPIWLFRLLVWFCGVLMGFGAASLTVLSQINTNTNEIAHLKQAGVDLSAGQKADRDIFERRLNVMQDSFDRRILSTQESFDKRMELAVSLMREQSATERELIQLIKIQQNIKP